MHRLDRNTRNSRIRVYNFSLYSFCFFIFSVSMKSDSHPDNYILSLAAERIRGENILEITPRHSIP